MRNHVPVLLEESIWGLNLNKNSLVIDATADGGGHAAEILKKLGPRGKLAALDLDPQMAKRLREKFRNDERVKIFHLNFRDLRKLGDFRPDAIFFDLGLSSLQLVSSGRGFSFRKDEPLVMRFDPAGGPGAGEFLAEVGEKELAEIIWKYGEERRARKIAAAIVKARKRKAIKTAGELGEIILRVGWGRGKIHPATKTFQALRIYLNRELENLEAGLQAAFEILRPGGKIAVISFHSLEDRIVKNFFREKARGGNGQLITKKPLVPAREEILSNPRSRSAKLRIIEKIK